MGKTYDIITSEIADWLKKQRMFFVATAPLSKDGSINCSPKGIDTFRILGPREVAYLDLTGSGIETVSHLRENGRIVFLFCAFEGPAKIIRLHGNAESIPTGSARFQALAESFPSHPGARAIIRADLTRISDSCGFGVPLYDYRGERDTLLNFAHTKGPEGLETYRRKANAKSIDGLPGL